MGAAWEKLLLESPHEFRLGLAPGDQLPADPPFPVLTVIAQHELYVRRLVWQVTKAHATLGERAEQLAICRLVAELEGDGGEVELHREIIPADAVGSLPIDTSVCAACNLRIFGSGRDGIDHIVIDGKAYHKGCVDD